MKHQASADRTTLGHAIVRRIGDLFGLDVGDDIDLDQNFVQARGFALGGYDFDSLDLVDIMVRLEDELDVPLLDADDTERLASIGALAAYALDHGPAEAIAAFTQEWAPPSVTGATTK